MMDALVFRPNPVAILRAIGTTVAVAAGSLYLAMMALWFSGRLANVGDRMATSDFAGAAWGAAILAVAVATAWLWRYSGRAAPKANRVYRAAYAVGLALVIGWWLSIVLLGVSILI